MVDVRCESLKLNLESFEVRRLVFASLQPKHLKLNGLGPSAFIFKCTVQRPQYRSSKFDGSPFTFNIFKFWVVALQSAKFEDYKKNIQRLAIKVGEVQRLSSAKSVV